MNVKKRVVGVVVMKIPPSGYEPEQLQLILIN